MIFGFRDQQTREQGADDRRQSGCGGRQTGEDDDEQAYRQKQFGALGPCRLGKNSRKNEPSENKHADNDRTAQQQCSSQIIPAAIGGDRGRDRAEQENDRNNGDVLEQKHRQRRAANRALRAGHGKHQSGRRKRQRQPQPQRAGGILAEKIENRRNDQAGCQQLRRADAENEPAERPEPFERQFQSDREEQQYDPHFGERLDRLPIADGDELQPGILVLQRSQSRGTEQDADQNESDDRCDPETGKCGNYDSCRTENHDGVNEGWVFERTVHGATLYANDAICQQLT